MTMTQDIKHHLNEDVLMAYAAGTLPEAFNLIVAAHVSLCDTCRAAAESYDAVGGALLETDNSVELSAGSLDATLALIAQGAPRADQTHPARRAFCPDRCRIMLAVIWTRSNGGPVGMGVETGDFADDFGCHGRGCCIFPPAARCPITGTRAWNLRWCCKGAFQDGR